jgi:hypothetical protein
MDRENAICELQISNFQTKLRANQLVRAGTKEAVLAIHPIYFVEICQKK